MALLKSATAAIIAAVAAPALAAAAPAPSPEQAMALQQQVQAWLTEITGGMLEMPPGFVQFTPEGNHYRVTAPLGTFAATVPKDAAATATARMIDDTRWQIDDQRLPPSFQVTTKQSIADAPDAKDPGPNHRHPETITYVVTIGDQSSHAVFDPTYATPTSSESTLTSLDVHTEGGSMPSFQHWDRYAAQSSLRPTTPGRVDVLTDSTIEGFHATQALPDGTATRTEARRFHVVGTMTGLAHDRLIPVVNAAINAVMAANASSKAPGDPVAKAADLAGGRNLLVAAHELLTGGRIEETGEDVAFEVGDHAGSIGKVTVAFGADGPQDMLTGTMTLGLDGLQLAELPAAFAAYVPKHVLLTPTVSNVSAADLTRMAMDMTAPGSSGKLSPEDIAALFSHGGIVFGVDSLALDIADTQFTGTGKFTMVDPNTVDGQMEISARGLDALIVQAQADPLLRRGVPAIIFLKGIAHTSSDQSVWQIAVANKAVTINGVDLSALAGGMR